MTKKPETHTHIDLNWRSVLAWIFNPLGISILALVISAASFTFSVIQYVNEDNEHLTIRVESSTNMPVQLPFNNFGEHGFLIQLPFKTSLSNTGKKTLSIVDYEIFQLLDDGPIKNNKLSYSGIDGGLYDINGEQLTTPINIQQGETKSLYMYVGVLISKAVMEHLKKQKETSLTRNEIIKVLSEIQSDLYGNKTIKVSENAIKFTSVSQAPIFYFEWKSGKGNKFTSLGGDYMHPQF